MVLMGVCVLHHKQLSGLRDGLVFPRNQKVEGREGIMFALGKVGRYGDLSWYLLLEGRWDRCSFFGVQ